MATCKYTFIGADGKSTTVEGIPALKEFLLQGGLEQYLPSRAAELLALKADADVGTPFDVAFSGRQTPVNDWPRTEEPDGFEAKPGDSITVIRLANMEGLVNTNAASVQGLASYISMIDDGETGAGSEGVNSDNIYVYKVKVPEGGFGEYSLLRAGKPVVGGAVTKAGRQEARYGGYWYSFTEGTEADLLATVPLADVRKAAAAIEREQADSMPWSKAPMTDKQAAELKGDFDRIGTEAGAKALRDAFAGAGISLSRREQIESLGINVNQDGENQYADKIVDGQKTLETRASDSLRPYVGKRVAIVRTGDGPAKAIGAVTIGEPIKVTTQKQFDQYRDQTLVPKDSKFDIAPGGVKYLYPVENPVRYAAELDVGLGIVARKVIAPSLSRREQKNAAASRVSNVSADRFKRTDELQQAVTDLQEGKITQDEYNAMVDELRPVYPYEKVPALTTPTDAKYALANGRGQSAEKAAKYGLPSDTLAKGDFAQLRLDIPSYQEHDAWVVSVHTPKSTNRQVQAAYDAGTVIGYESAAAMTDATFGMNQKAATKIAQGTSKGTIATILGKWKPISNQAAKVRADAAIKDPAWTQVGMDPFRHSYFYDRDTMRPVLSADEVIQLGPLVLAKNATFSEDGTDITGAPIAFSPRGGNDINAKLEQLILSDFGGAVRQYSEIEGTEKGKKIDVDLIRNLSPEYRADRSLAPQVHEASSAFSQMLYNQRLEEAKPGGVITFMSGGGGAGKSSAEALLKPILDESHTIFDGTLSSIDKAKRNIKAALDKEQAVIIAHVYREPVDSLVNGVFNRAMDPKNGRTVTLESLVKTHAGSNQVIRQLQQEFGDNPLFKIHVIDNSRGSGNYAEIDIADLPVVGREGLLEKFQDATEEEFDAGRIDQRVYYSTLDTLKSRADGSQAKAKQDVQRDQRKAERRQEPSEPSYSVKQRELAEDAKQQQVFLQKKAEEAGYKTIDEFGDKDFDGFVLAASQWRQENPADMMFSNRQSDGWILSRDETGRFRFGAGAKAYRLVADVANNVLDRIGMKPVSPELSRALRKMKIEVEKAQNLTVDVAKNLKDLPEQERQMISDVIEGELKRGVKPPKHVLELAASMQSIMSEQTQELVRLGMLTADAAGRWDGKYLPRFYESKIGDETKSWMKAAKSLMGRTRTMQGITGNSLKARGMFENVPVADVQDWLAEGWEVRDPTFDPLTSDVVTMWRDYTRNERDDMGEIRDAMFRFVMGYNKSQRDLALGRLYENLATSYASRVEKPGYVKVPSTTIEDTANVRRYGKLGGKWVPKEVMDQLSTFDTSMQNDLLKMYLKGLSMWKEGKTVLNPVSHANNVLSNLTMAHFAGVSYWDAGKYAGAVRDLVKGDAMVDEAKEAGLFGGTFNRSELMDQLPEQLKAMAQMTESKAGMAADRIWNAMSFFLRKPAGKAYEAEDLFFRYLIYRDARKRGMDVEDAVDWSQNFIFTYDDLPKGARLARDFALPFFSYTYKVVPILARTALEHPMRYAAPAAALYTVNALMYAMAASLGGGEDEDWWTVIRRYATDPEFRNKARKMEEQERENLPPWMKGASATLATPKAIRLGMDDVTNLPVFLDVSRVFPGGDLLDANANAGGVPLLQPITPSNPVLNTVGAMIWNKDPFFGKDIVDKNDTSAEAAAKRGKWLWQQFAPAVAIGNYHWDRALNVIANVTGQDILGYTGTGKDGLPVQPGFAAMQTMGIKARPIDLELSEQINKAQQEKLIRDLEAEMRQIDRLAGKGAITEKSADAQRELQQIKKQRLREGLTVEGEKRK